MADSRKVAGYVNPEGTGAIFPDDVYSRAEVVGFCRGSEERADEIFEALGRDRSDSVWGHELRERVDGFVSAEDMLARYERDEEE